MNNCKKTGKTLYLLINLMFGVAAVFFLYSQSGAVLKNPLPALYILGTVFTGGMLVQVVKGYRLYILFDNTKIRPHRFCLQYAKTTVVSILLPFKIGDLFKMFCFGAEINNFMISILIIIVDRVIDTMALTVMMTVMIFNGSDTIRYLYLFFLLCIGLAGLLYYSFPSTYRYWNHRLIQSSPSKRILFWLNFWHRCNQIYLLLRHVLKGKVPLIFMLSLLGWGIEIAFFCIYALMTGSNFSPVDFDCYLCSIILGIPNVFLGIYIMAATCGMLFLWFIMVLVSKRIKHA